jgi:uncharacterized protein YcaQ
LLHLTNTQARQLILHLQGLTHPPHKSHGADGLEALIGQLGFVQQDSIRWVERAHHMTLFARNQTYRPKHLEKLHEGGVLFENWTHDASLIPSGFWCYWKHKFARDEARLRGKFTKWQGEGFEKHIEALRERIDRKGEIRSRDLEKPKGEKLDMWQWHDGKAAMEFMWRTGQLAVPRREGFQKVYDLSERVIPQAHFKAEVSHEEFVDWACRSALDRLGFGTASDIAKYWYLLSIAEVNEWLETHGRQETMRVSVQPHNNDKPRDFFASLDLEAILDRMPEIPARLRMLSPFDPVIRDRKRLSWLFGFDYTIEIYVPPEKRKYGYYVFPLLEKDKLIGRIDCQARRVDDCIYVTQIWLEDKTRWSRTKQEKLNAELARQARLCGVKNIVWDKACSYLPN